MLLVWTLLVACAEPAAPPKAEAPSGPGTELTTTGGRYRLRWEPSPAPIVQNALFEVRTTLVDAKTGAPVEDATVRVDARMPDHGHGMETLPQADPGACDPAGACRHPGGVYLSRGMKFHMPGTWTLLFEVEGPAGSDRVEAGFLL